MQTAERSDRLTVTVDRDTAALIADLVVVRRKCLTDRGTPPDVAERDVTPHRVARTLLCEAATDAWDAELGDAALADASVRRGADPASAVSHKVPAPVSETLVRLQAALGEK